MQQHMWWAKVKRKATKHTLEQTFMLTPYNQFIIVTDNTQQWIKAKKKS